MEIRSSDVFLKKDIEGVLRALVLTAHAVATPETGDFERGYLTALAAVAIALNMQPADISEVYTWFRWQ